MCIGIQEITCLCTTIKNSSWISPK